jgi:hypothetical protein
MTTGHLPLHWRHMQARTLLLALVVPTIGAAQKICDPTPAYSACELVFELDKQELAAHPNPYLTVQIHAEIRSPRYRTVALPAFWDGAGHMVIRFAPTGAGEWEYRITSNIARFNNKQGIIVGTESSHPGFIRPANGHHWQYTESKQPHLWMGDTSYTMAWLDAAAFQTVVDTRAAQKFTHIRGYAIGRNETGGATYANPDQPDHAFFRKLDERLAYVNSKGIVFDMILGHDRNHLADLFPTWQQRERFIRYMVARYSAFNITWQVMQEFEEYKAGRELSKEIGTLLKKMDPYQHPRSTHTVSTSSPLLADGWMDYAVYQSSDDALGAIEHQLFAVPFVNAEFAYENSGSGKTHEHHVDSDTFRRRLWNSTMNGQYPTYGNTGTYGSAELPQDIKYLEAPGAKAMTVWFDFMSKTRYWDLEPYFDIDGARALALPGVEYILYVERPSGPVEVRLEKHDYDVKWLNPITGEALPQKNFKAEKYAIEPPDNQHDWVLHISREGRKEGMLRSYKFESRPFLMQEVESGVKLVPYEIAEPAAQELSVSRPPKYSTKLKRESRATRSMFYLWTGEVAANNQGYRVIGTGDSGTLRLPRMFAETSPSVISVRVYGMNANGKVYFTDRVYRGVP